MADAENIQQSARDSHRVGEDASPLDRDEYNGRWEGIWGTNLQPGQLFDAGKSSPVLGNLLDSPELSPMGKRALVPGCGRGYDLAEFARRGAARAVGLELAPSAVTAAREWVAGSGLAPEALARVRVEAADFFTYEDADGQFDLGFDYTFLCALHPDMRPGWAASWARLLRPGGRLLTIVFPMHKDPNCGPPWGVSPELYNSLLPPAGFVCERLEDVPPHLSHESRSGKEMIGVWKRA